MCLQSEGYGLAKGLGNCLWKTRCVRPCNIRLVFLQYDGFICDVKEHFSAKVWPILSFQYCRYPQRGIFLYCYSQPREKKGSIYEDTDEESSSEDEIPGSFSQQWLEGNLTNVNKSLCPAIAYWVALTTVNGAPASPISVHKAPLLLDNPSIPLAVNKVFNTEK